MAAEGTVARNMFFILRRTYHQKLVSTSTHTYLRDENVLHHTSKEETHVAVLVAIGMMVVTAFNLATCGAFSVSSTAECLKDSELVRKDTRTPSQHT